MEEAFTRVVCRVFNNWTALKLAVEHSTGGPDSRQIARECVKYVVDYCLYCPKSVEISEIQTALEEILDEEFDTICEDDSPKEVATILFNFVTMIKEGNNEQYNVEFEKLPPVMTDWLSQPETQVRQIMIDTSSDDSHSDDGMDQDGWIEIKSRRRR